MTAAEALREATAALREAGLEGAARDARLLLAHAMGLAADRVGLHLSDPIDPAAQARLAGFVQARSRRQPVSQIIGQRLFWGRPFRVTRDVLDPRPETELLVAIGLEEPFAQVLDLGTGSGAILLSLLADRPAATGLGVDLSEPALAVARENAERLGVTRAAFRHSDWFAAVEGQFDLIVANPPYIAAGEMPGLAPDVRDWEPALALSPGGDGLQPYRIIAAAARGFLRPGGRLAVEIGPTQGAAVAAMFHAGGLAEVTVRPDLDGRDRVVLGRNP